MNNPRLRKSAWVKILCLVAVLLPLSVASAQSQTSPAPKQIYPGVWRFTFGVPETITPASTRRYVPAADGLSKLPRVDVCPIKATGVAASRGFLVTLPVAANELVYGLGLQLQSFQQRGLKKKLRVNADPVVDSGDSHAPVPFYVTTRGYGVLIDTARYATFYVGNKRKKPGERPTQHHQPLSLDGWNGLSQSEQNGMGQPSDVLVEIPIAHGIDVYVFAGPTMRGAVQRYNLFSGGGPLPPRWGLGFWYRVEKDFGQDDVLRMAGELRDRRMPMDVLGLEPHWQSHSYSGSFTWAKSFPDPGAMIERLREEHFRLNLWEHAFTHPSSPMYADLLPHAGDYQVWGGIVPDFLTTAGRRIFANYHEQELLSLGVSGFKLDECDNSDFTGNWSFPEISQFPSGADGEQMHSLFGLRYQDTIQSAFEKQRLRTYGLVRSSGALAAPYPYVLYSDLYDHRRFIHGVAQAGFSGLLWTPEVRHARDQEDLIRRLQSVALSPLAMINAWYLKNPPWKQVDRNANNSGQFDPHWEDIEARCREIFELRMRLVPYLHSAFVRYQREGLPPFRALVMDYPDDAEVRTVSNEYLMGEDLLVAPVVAGESERSVYLPEGEWWDYWTGQRHAGRQRMTVRVPLDRIPLFVKGGTILPLAQPTLHTDDAASWQLTATVFGSGTRPATLFEDDGSANPPLTEVRLEWDVAARRGRIIRSGPQSTPGYTVIEWKSFQ